MRWTFFPSIKTGDNSYGNSGNRNDTINTPPATTTPVSTSSPDSGAIDFSKVIPAEYQGKEYLKDIKDIPSLFKNWTMLKVYWENVLAVSRKTMPLKQNGKHLIRHSVFLKNQTNMNLHLLRKA